MKGRRFESHYQLSFFFRIFFFFGLNYAKIMGKKYEKLGKICFFSYLVVHSFSAEYSHQHKNCIFENFQRCADDEDAIGRLNVSEQVVRHKNEVNEHVGHVDE